MYGAVPLRHDQAAAARLSRGRHAGPGRHGAADQLHLRRHRLRRRAGHAWSASRSSPTWCSCGTRPGSRSPAATRSTGQRTAMAQRDAAARATLQDPAYAKRYAEFAAGFGAEAWDDEERARHPADARPGADPGARVRHALDAQDADRAAPGFDDPCLGPGLQGQGRRRLPRGLHDPHLDLAELPDPGVARRRPAPGRARGLRARAAPARARDEAARAVANHPLLSAILRFLRVGDVVPPQYRDVGRRATTTTSSRLEQHAKRPGASTSSRSTRPVSRCPSAPPAWTATRSRATS